MVQVDWVGDAFGESDYSDDWNCQCELCKDPQDSPEWALDHATASAYVAGRLSQP
jgi:hypothetical protein